MTAIFASAAFVAGLIVGWPAPCVLACVAAVTVLLRPERVVGMAIVVACALAGDLRGDAMLDDVALSPVHVAPFEGEVATYARRIGSRQSFELVTDQDLHLCVRSEGRLRLGRGDRIVVEGVVIPRGDTEPARAAALRALGCAGTVEATEVRVLSQGDGWRRRLEDQRRGIAGWFETTVPGDAGALLSGLVIGDDDALSFDARERFYDLGMSHITAVSGTNLALLSWLLLRSGSRRPFAVDLGTLALLWGYVFLAGAGPSTIRAGLTATLCVVVVRTGRRPELVTIACLVAAGQVAVDPSLIGNLGYRLSTIAMLVMLSTLSGREDAGWRGKVTSLVLCSVAIQLATLPFTPQRDQAIVAGIVANVVAAPLVGAAFALGMAAAVVHPVSGSVAEAIALVAEIPSRGILWLIDVVASSAIARIKPGVLEALPLLVMQGALLAGVTVAFGRHARRSIRDVREGIERMERQEVLVALSGVSGAALGALVAAISR